MLNERSIRNLINKLKRGARKGALELKFPKRYVDERGLLYVEIMPGLWVCEDGNIYTLDPETGKRYPVRRLI